MALVPPPQRDGFSYAVDSLYCQASNSSRHRRATVPELNAHFNGKDTENRTAHWYEAQLLHYGLPPSKVKGTAHKRLFDALTSKGGLTVPAHIQKIEADLKKEWNKKEREAKKLTKASSGAAAAAPAKGTKRKAEQASNTNVSVNVSVQISNTGAVTVDAAQPASKRAKTSKPSSTTTSKKAKTSGPTSSSTASSKKAAASAPKEKKTASTKSQKTNPVSNATSSPKPTKLAAKPKAPAKPTAQRSAASNSRGVAAAAYEASSAGYEDDAPPPYSEYDQDEASVSYPSSPRRNIGLLNGRYRVTCPFLEDSFPDYGDDLALIATLDGNKIWLKFDFGAVTGLMQAQRPYEPDDEYGRGMFWRGFALDGFDNRRFFNKDTIFRAGPVNKLWFEGGGHIRGMISWDGQDVDFDAYRLSGQSRTSEVSPTEARAEWAQLEQDMDTSW